MIKVSEKVTVRHMFILGMMIITGFHQYDARAEDTELDAFPPSIEITTQELPDGYQNDEYSTKINAQGGRGVYHFVADPLPPGLKFNRSGRLSGKLKGEPGTYSLMIVVLDPEHPNVYAERWMDLVIHPRPGIEEQKLPFAMVGQTYENRLKFQGGSPSCHLWIEGLPEGLEVDEEGLIQGTPREESGKFHLKAIMDDPRFPRQKIVCDLELTVFEPLSITTGDLGPFLVGEPINETMAAQGGSGTYVFEAENLVKGLSLDPSGRLKGTPSVSRGTGEILVRLIDEKFPTNIEKKLTLTLVDFHPDAFESSETGFGNRMVPNGPAQDHSFDQPGDTDAVILDLQGVSPGDVIRFYSERLTRDTHTVMTLEESPEKGLLLSEGEDKSDYAGFYGICNTPGLYVFRMSEARGETGDYTLKLRRMGQRVRLVPEALPDQQTMGPVSLEFHAVSGSGEYEFTATGLPEGLILSEDGKLSGTLTAPAGTYTMTVTVRDRLWGNLSDIQDMSLKVVDFFPDAFESAGDDDFHTSNALKPGSAVQKHTFHTPGDKDRMMLILSGIRPDHVICVKTMPLTRETTLPRVTVMDSDFHEIAANDRKKTNGATTVYADARDNRRLFVTVEEIMERTGDYRFSVEDAGPRLSLLTESLPDGLAGGSYDVRLRATHGSGTYHFFGKKLPPGLLLDESGRLKGDLNLSPGTYEMVLEVRDAVHEGIADQQTLTLKVVEYFPDDYESLNDGGRGTENRFAPGEPVQAHCFHEKGDEDWVHLDLNAVNRGDLILLESGQPGKEIHLQLQVLDSQGRVLADRKASGERARSILMFPCPRAGDYWLAVRETENMIGEYTLALHNGGQPLSFQTQELGFAESDLPYQKKMNVTGGLGDYRFTIVEGALPEGLSLDPATGIVAGNSTAWGTFQVTVLAEDARFPENNTRREYSLEAYMGRKLAGETLFVFPHYLAGSYSLSASYVRTRAFPGTLEGGTPGNLRYKILEHSIPKDRFSYSFNTENGILDIEERVPVSCSQYTDMDLDVAVEVRDRKYTNNAMVFHYEIPARCLSY